MECISGNMGKGLKEFWKRKRRSYRRLYGSGRRQRMDTVELGGGTSTTTGTRRRRRWRIKISRKIKITKISSPKKMVMWLRDAYVSMMTSLANSKVMTICASVTGNGGIREFGKNPPHNQDYDKMVAHMYKSFIAAQGQLVP
ncbi:hypothetical protein TanjilG_14545 [Lupinus angustifolius]|uniref:Uncharacterized protein n=1 Tax=Lupinus angustifolius TaxID=3871 RepID=A0A394DFQ1_LUPAN|nr:PREDICTED: uncharacterized protein LOC109340809 [Lupinus angustifolius]OIW21900.1 hypothetical protein TanjilG_14545 [Lupinus angustifolius]